METKESISTNDQAGRTNKKEAEEAALESLKLRIVEALEEAERQGCDRGAVAELLEQYSITVLDGHTELPEDRGDWWAEVHDEETEQSANIS